MAKKLKFPAGFLWGVAASSYQIEGNNSNTDWWEWEKQGKTNEQSGTACDYWNQYEKDHDLLQKLGVRIFRTSIEWARIEPEEGVFSAEAINHYREILGDLKKRNIKTQVTLWWWTSPIWFQKKYGFHRRASIDIFSRYVEKATSELGDLIDIFTVFNEPMVPLGQGFLGGIFPPGSKNPCKFIRAVNHVAAAHKKSYEIIHRIKPEAQVGITYLYNWYESEGSGFFLNAINRIAQWYRIGLLGNKIKDYQDYIGINYYRLGKIRFDMKNIKLDSRHQTYFGFTIEEDSNNPMRWITYAKGMKLVLEEAYEKYKKPIFITENGTPTNAGIEDDNRVEYIKTHLIEVHKCIERGIPVLGYNYWSLLDNFEWLDGYRPRFGLVEIDFSTLERKPRKSFYEYAKICKENALEIDN